MGLHCFPLVILQLFMPLNACLDFKWAYLRFPFILLELFMSLNACSDFKLRLTLFSFHTFGIIHVP